MTTILYKILPGQAMTKKKSTLALICMLGLVLLIKTQTCYNQHQTGLTEVVNAAHDPAYSTWLGLGLVFLHNAFSSQAEVLRLGTQVCSFDFTVL